MLGKLLKHEFRATRRSVGMVILGSLLASAVGFGLLILCWHPNFLPALHGDAIETIRTILYIPLSVITFGVYALGFASSIITLIFILMRYYKNFFTDEGYLTFTLPVTPHELLWTKLISGMIWLSLSFVTTFAAIASLCGACYINGVASGGAEVAAGFSEMFNGLGRFFSEFMKIYAGSPDVWFVILRSVLEVIVTGMAQLLIYYFAITLGCMISKKHKVWASVGMYFAVNAGIGIVNSFVSYIVMFISALINDGTSSEIIISIVAYSRNAVTFIVGVVMYFLTINIFKKRLNLE